MCRACEKMLFFFRLYLIKGRRKFVFAKKAYKKGVHPKKDTRRRRIRNSEFGIRNYLSLAFKRRASKKGHTPQYKSLNPKSYPLNPISYPLNPNP